MKQEDKELLLKDLCARLPYGVKLKVGNDALSLDMFYFDEGLYKTIEKVITSGNKMYLHPISSMTETEMDKLFDILHIDKDGNGEDWIKINDVLGIKFFFPTGKWVENVIEAYDYLNSIHIDYRGLIPMGLALEAPKGMYKVE